MYSSAVEIESNFEYCRARQGDAEQRTAGLVESIIKDREENTTKLGEALYKYKKPVLDKIQTVQLELRKKENADPKKQEELKKQLDSLNTELENAGKNKSGGYEAGVQKLIDRDEDLSSKATKLIGYSGKDKESLQQDNEAAKKLFTDTLKHGNQTDTNNGSWLPSPMLRAIKKINPFSVN